MTSPNAVSVKRSFFPISFDVPSRPYIVYMLGESRYNGLYLVCPPNAYDATYVVPLNCADCAGVGFCTVPSTIEVGFRVAPSGMVPNAPNFWPPGTTLPVGVSVRYILIPKAAFDVGMNIPLLPAIIIIPPYDGGSRMYVMGFPLNVYDTVYPVRFDAATMVPMTAPAFPTVGIVSPSRV